jgi:hypothetical protein
MSCKQGLNKCIFNDIVDYYGVAEQSFRF